MNFTKTPVIRKSKNPKHNYSLNYYRNPVHKTNLLSSTPARQNKVVTLPSVKLVPPKKKGCSCGK